MSSNEHKYHTSEEKVAILRWHLIEGVLVSTLCDESQIHPTVFYGWLKHFFENETAAFMNKAPLSGPRGPGST
jgi:transposase-like protein